MAKKSFNLTEEFLDIDTSKTQVKHTKYTRFLENEKIDYLVKTNEYKRINMGFSDLNYELIQSETNRLGINIAYFINALIRIIEEQDISDYIAKQPFKRDKYAIRRKGIKMQRINLKFPMENYNKIFAGSQKYETTISQYVNMLVEIYGEAK